MRIVFLCLVLMFISNVKAELKLPLVISDGMVIQRDLPAHVWGWAAPGAGVSVSLDGQTASTEADAGGRWSVHLEPLMAGGPYHMTVSTDATTIEVKDILAGDVWVCSGQSNMEWILYSAEWAEEFITQANDPLIRHFKVPLSWAETPEETLAGGSWKAASPATVGDFTAVGYHFALSLRESTGVPIGLINASWGGTRIEPWISQEAGVHQPNAFRAELEASKALRQEDREHIRRLMGEVPEKDSGISESGVAVYADPALDDQAWYEIPVPGPWEEAGFEGFDGIAWYRITFELPGDYTSQPGIVGLANVDDQDRSWVNGVEVGSDTSWTKIRRYPVPAGVLKPGHNVIAVRVEDNGSIGGMRGEEKDLFVETGEHRLDLAGNWRFLPTEMRDPVRYFQQLPTALHNKMINPIQPFPIKGAIWYQGESNANGTDAPRYGNLLEALIHDWRRGWAVGDFPFLFVQLSSYSRDGEQGVKSNWAVLREQQSSTLVLPNTGQAVTIDIGDPLDIHPRNKHDVGKRLALAARAKAYREDITYSGPVYDGSEIRGDRVILYFQHASAGLAVANGTALQGFLIAGKDRVFHPAEATVSGSSVEVHSNAVPEPVAVRYAWADSPMDANLINKEGLPASPFRTDKWADATAAK